MRGVSGTTRPNAAPKGEATELGGAAPGAPARKPAPEWRVWARLGRISNLPTVWTNTLAGAALAGGAGALSLGGWTLLLIALSLFYVGGMYLNDAIDAKIDAAERAERPIPQGLVSRDIVFMLGFGMLGVGGVALFALGAEAGLAGLGLALFVLLYDVLHKKTVFSPVLMGACRFFVYLAAGAAAFGAWPESHGLWWGAAGLFLYVVGLTYAAKQEAYDRIDRVWPLAVLALPVAIAAFPGFANPGASEFTLIFVALLVVWMGYALRLLFRRGKGDVPRAVVSLIAGIALYDAALIAAAGHFELALLALAGFAATLWLQRVAPGT